MRLLIVVCLSLFVRVGGVIQGIILVIVGFLVSKNAYVMGLFGNRLFC